MWMPLRPRSRRPGIAVEHCGVHLEERAKRAAHSVVKQDERYAELPRDAIGGSLDLRRVRNVASMGLASRDFTLEPSKALGASRPISDPIAARRKALRYRRPCAGTDAGNDADRLCTGVPSYRNCDPSFANRGVIDRRKR
jgi:hypothetical protein